MESKLKAAAQDSVGERTEFTPSIVNKRFPDFEIPENAKVIGVKIGDKVATCVEELPNLLLREGGYPHLPTTPIKQEPELTDIALARNKEMKKFIMVHHNWFVDSKGFSVELLKCERRDDAQMRLDANTHRRNVTFNHCAGLLLELDMQEHLIQSRKLTIKERIFGRTFP